MMAPRTATVQVEYASREHPPEKLTAEGAAATIAGLHGQRDLTVTLDLDDADERLLIAVDGPAAFLGLERPDGLFQFVATSEPSGGTRTFVIGGQEAHIDLRNLVDVTTAAAVAKEWFERGEDSLHGHWERK